MWEGAVHVHMRARVRVVRSRRVALVLPSNEPGITGFCILEPIHIRLHAAAATDDLNHLANEEARRGSPQPQWLAGPLHKPRELEHIWIVG